MLFYLRLLSSVPVAYYDRLVAELARAEAAVC
jgi:hypothetical protein